jgi:hypothetical protein
LNLLRPKMLFLQRHPHCESVVPGMCRRRSSPGCACPIWRLCGLKNPLDNSSPDYADQTNFIIANSRPDDGSTLEHRTPSHIHLPTASTSYVCVKCDKLFRQYFSWDPICTHCEHDACPRCKHSAWHSHTCIDGVSLLRPHRHTAVLQDRRAQTTHVCLAPLDKVLTATSANFVPGTDIGGSSGHTHMPPSGSWPRKSRPSLTTMTWLTLTVKLTLTAPNTVVNDTTSCYACLRRTWKRALARKLTRLFPRLSWICPLL